MHRRTFLLATAAAPLLTARAFAQDVQTIPLDLTRRQPRVRLSINGIDRGEAIFDTGASGATFHRPLAEELGLPNTGPIQIMGGAGGPAIDAYMTRVAGAAINGVVIPDFDAAVMPMVRADTVSILSPAIFNGQLVRLDFQNAQMQILPKTASTIPPSVPVPYTSGEYPLPAIPVTLPGGVRLEGHLDTGSPANIMLPRTLADTLPLSTPLTEIGRARMVNAERVISRATLNGEARVGPITQTNPDLTFMEGLNHANIGMALLRQLNITLDPAERRLWLEAHA
jgi:predicted aspartyl protease